MSADIETVPIANFYTLPGAGPSQQILAVRQTYKARSSQTGGSLICIEVDVPPGAGVPLHRHSAEDESFYVLQGQVVIEGDDCGDSPIRLDTGGFFYGPRGRVHSFRNEGPAPAKLLIFITPGIGIEAMFAGLAELTRNSNPIDRAGVTAICGNNGVTFVPKL
jgi:quercetin dioxygenase-like cupin family protein